MAKKPLKMFKVNNISEVRDVDALYCIKTATDTEFSIVVTDAFGAIVNLKDLQTPAGIQGIASDNGTIEVTGTTFKNLRLSTTLVDAINNALKPGDNISDLVNDAGYLTSFTEIDPIFQASEASNFVSGDKANLDNQSGVNTGDETSTSIQAKRPLKTVDNKSLEGTGNIEIDYNTVINKPTSFPPSAHTHTVSQITDFPTIPTVDQTIIDGSTNAVSGNAVFDGLATKTTLATIAQIRALSGTLPNNYFYTTNIGQEGNWYYDNTDTTSADNTGNVLVTADGKRIKRILNDYIDLKWFGAIGDGIADDTTALQKAILESSNNKVRLVFEKSKIYVVSTLVPKNNLYIDLNGSTLKLKSNTNNLLFNGEDVAGNNFTIVNGVLDGNKIDNQINFNKSGGGIWLRSWDNLVFSNLKINNFFRAAFFISVNSYLTVKNVEVNNCGLSNTFGLHSYGLETELCNNILIENFKVDDMYGYGIHFLGSKMAKASGLFFNNMTKTGESIAITSTNASYLDISNVMCNNVDGDNIEINSTKYSNFRNLTINQSGDVGLLFGDHFVTGVSNENVNIDGLKITNTGGVNSLSLNNMINCSFTNVVADKGMTTLDTSFYPNDKNNKIAYSKFDVDISLSFVFYNKFNLKSVEFNDFYINLWDNSFGLVSNRKTVNKVGLSVLNSGIEYISIKNLNQFGVSGNMVGKLRVSSVFNNQQLSYQECSFLACNNLTTINLGTIEQLNGTFARAVTITTDPSNGRIVLTNNTGVTVNVYWIIDIINNT